MFNGKNIILNIFNLSNKYHIGYHKISIINIHKPVNQFQLLTHNIVEDNKKEIKNNSGKNKNIILGTFSLLNKFFSYIRKDLKVFFLK